MLNKWIARATGFFNQEAKENVVPAAVEKPVERSYSFHHLTDDELLDQIAQNYMSSKEILHEDWIENSKAKVILAKKYRALADEIRDRVRQDPQGHPQLEPMPRLVFSFEYRELKGKQAHMGRSATALGRLELKEKAAAQNELEIWAKERCANLIVTPVKPAAGSNPKL